MRIKEIKLTNYKRFSNLQIVDIPESARLVVLIGPNGSGKSSLFDAFLVKSQMAGDNFRLGEDFKDYYYKERNTSNRDDNTKAMWNRISVGFHNVVPTIDQWASIFNIRSPYRNEADFHLNSIEPIAPSVEVRRFERIIDPDQAVSDNYKRLTWKRMSDLDSDAPGHTTFDHYRRVSLGELQTALKKLFTDPDLQLQDFGGIRDAGVFRFSKATTSGFHYKNLSGGEKAAFDLLLDIFVKRHEYKDAVYCIDEPEAHVSTALHGRLLEVILEILPLDSQLWIATHSIGFVRKAFEMMKANDDVVFLDFSGHDLDLEVNIRPSLPDRTFWQYTYQVALDDLGDLIAPKSVIICEGKSIETGKSFDAECYNRIFESAHPDTLFLSIGASSQVENCERLIAVLQAVAKGIEIHRLIDRDDMTDEFRERRLQEGIRVLKRREIENYLFDPKVLRSFLKLNGKEDLVSTVLAKRDELLNGSTSDTCDTKSFTQNLFRFIRRTSQIANMGNTRDEFALEHLVPALRATPAVFSELEEVVFF